MEQALRGDLGWHAGLLLDPVRVNWFERAIRANVRAGDVVLDVGSGTGLLAMLAARAGARRVYAVEQSPIVEVARELIERNGLSERVEVVAGSSFDLELPERAGVVVSETLGTWGADEGIAAIMADARTRLARPRARLVPDGLTMWLAPVDLADARLSAPHLDALGLDFGPFFARLGAGGGPFSGPGAATVAPERLLAPAQVVLALALGRDDPARHSTVLRFMVNRSAGAVAGWFSVTARGVAPLSTSPADPATNWSQLLMPLPAPIAGALRVEVELSFERDGMGVALDAAPDP